MSNREGNEVATVSPLQRLHEPAHTRLSSRYSEVWLPSSTLHQPRCSELAFAEPMTLINCFAKATPPLRSSPHSEPGQRLRRANTVADLQNFAAHCEAR